MSNRKLIHTLHMLFLLLPLSILAGCAGKPPENPLPSEPTSALSEAPITNTLAPTATPVTTNTPAPTVTPVPTSEPTPTVTLVPTSEPTPTVTLAPTSTLTPTATPLPTSTPAPTATPLPTSTPVPTATPIPTVTSGADFYHTSGTSIVDSGNTPVLLKGIAMGNMVWSSSNPPTNDHNEDSFRELSELGFNSVRFYLSYRFFEEDQTPYVYKESGFDWLDQNIAWAKKYGIRLILNMHVPQGGYQSQGQGLALWQNSENQKRLIALWTEIAGRYADEEAIIGYSLINEPVVPLLSDKSATFAQCPSLMQRITDGIRTRDPNHIIFAERLCAVVDPTTGQADWGISNDDGLYLLDDQNTAYEFHSYAPHSFTHQNMDWAGTAGKITTYPSTNPIFSDAVSYWTGCSWSTPKEDLNDGWTLYESEFASLSENSNAGCIALMAARTGSNGTVLFDDIVVEEYKDGSFQRVITKLNFDTDTATDDFNYWSEDGSGRYFYFTEGYNSSRCVALSGTTADANLSGYRFELREGYEYKVTGKVKYLSTDADCSARPRIDHALFGSITYCDYDYLEDVLVPYLEFGKKNQVPIYLGEFGVCVPAWEESTGAGQWVTDMLTLCNKYRIHFNYHAYYDYSFGLHRLPADSPDTQKNEELAEIFKEMLGK